MLVASTHKVQRRAMQKFLKPLTNKDNLLLMCFVADLLFLIKVFQKKLQSDSLIIADIEPVAEKFHEKVNKLSDFNWTEMLPNHLLCLLRSWPQKMK